MKRGKRQLKRAYDQPDRSDGYRVLVDRLWPRGLKKEDAQLDAWMKNAAPPPDLRKWFGHDPQKWDAFSKAYHQELEHSQHLASLLAIIDHKQTVPPVNTHKNPNHPHP